VPPGHHGERGSHGPGRARFSDWDELVLGHLRFPSCLESSGEIGALSGRIHALFSDSGGLVLSDVLYVLAGASLPVVPLALVKPFIVSVSRDPC
jgi:hypothetical protein